MSTLEQLKNAFDAADLRQNEIRRTREEEHYKRLEAFKDQLNKELEDKYGAIKKQASDEYWAAKKALDDERDRIARLGAGGKYPVGTKLVQKKLANRWCSTLVDEFGVYECVTKDSQFAETGRRRGRSSPALGSFVVRLLKKDGKPSLKCYPCYADGSLPHGWAVAGGAV